MLRRRPSNAQPLERAVSFAAVVCLAACSSGGHPPLAGNLQRNGDNSSPDAGPSGEGLIVDFEDEVPSTCGAVNVELAITRPNFYFVMDASGSMEEPMPDSGGLTRHEAARNAVEEMLRRVGHRVNFGAATFPRPNRPDGCTTGAEIYELGPGEPLEKNGDAGPKLDALISRLRHFAPSGATPTAATLKSLAPKLTALEGPTSIFLLTDGAPNCDTSEPCDGDRCIPNIEHASFADGLTCDSETNCCADNLLPYLCLDEDDTSEVLGDLAIAGVQTYVLGIPGSEVYAEILNQMARAAGTAREGDTDYYRVSDAQELALTLIGLGRDLSLTCEFDLGTEPERPGLVNVYVDEDPLVLDNEDGWQWSQDETVELLGRACERWLNGETGRVRVFEGCPVVMK